MISLRYQKGITAVLLGGKTPEQIRQNVESFSFEPDREDIEYLDQISKETTAKLPDWTGFFKDLALPMD